MIRLTDEKYRIGFDTNGPLFQGSVRAVFDVLREAVPADHILLAALRFAGRMTKGFFGECLCFIGYKQQGRQGDR